MRFKISGGSSNNAVFLCRDRQAIEFLIGDTLREYLERQPTFDLNEDVAESVVEMIKTDVLKHKLLVFSDQGKMSGHRQVGLMLCLLRPSTLD